MLNQEVFTVESFDQIGKVRREVLSLTEKIGFSKTVQSEISIAITELTTNLAKYATEGKIIVKEIVSENNVGIEIISLDSGPGIQNTDLSLKDGFSTSGSMGSGLGAVKRFMDVFDIYNKAKDQLFSKKHSIEEESESRGTFIVCRKWLKAEKTSNSYSAYSRPYPGEIENGDCYFIKEFDDKLLVAVFDGLGHGPDAHKAAEIAYDYLEEFYHQSLDQILMGVHNSLRGTRGGVMGLALIDRKNNYLAYCGIGNISIQVFNTPSPIRPISFNGTLGAVLTNIKVMEYDIYPGSVIILSSDGVSNKFNLDYYPALINKHAAIIAHTLFNDYSRLSDDATIVVVK